MDNTKKDKMFDPTAGLDEILSMPSEIETNTGEKILVPAASWRMELQVVKSLGRLLSTVRKELGFTWDDIKSLQTTVAKSSAQDPETLKQDELTRKEKLLDLVIKLAEVAPDELSSIAATIIGRDVEFVEKELDLGVIIQVLLPFLMQRMKRLIELMERMDVDFVGVTQGIREKFSQEAPSTPKVRTKSPR